jgi:transcriptional antiterminator RfaH
MRLATLPERVVETIKRRRDPDSGLVRLEPVPVANGDRVEVFDGPLAGLQGIFTERKGNQRALLLMTLLGTVSTVEVDALLLQKVT